MVRFTLRGRCIRTTDGFSRCDRVLVKVQANRGFSFGIAKMGPFNFIVRLVVAFVAVRVILVRRKYLVKVLSASIK